MDREKWLEERKKRLGASEVAAILGMSQFSTPFEIYCNKRDLLEPWKGNDATRLGHRLEPAILDEAEADLGKLERQKSWVHDYLPLAATLDGQVIDTGEVVEAKTAIFGFDNRAWTDDTFPEAYWVQVQAQLMCSKADHAYLYALVAQQGMRKYRVEPNEKFQEYLKRFIGSWWQKHIVRDVPPSLDGVKPQTIARLRRQVGKQIDLQSHSDDLLRKYQKAKANRQRWSKVVDQLQVELIGTMDDAEIGITPEGHQMSYRKQQRKGFTVEPSESRVFRVKENKNG